MRGLMARSVVSENVTVEGGEWHNSSTEPGWKWKGDTSSDEVCVCVCVRMHAHVHVHMHACDTLSSLRPSAKHMHI